MTFALRWKTPYFFLTAGVCFLAALPCTFGADFNEDGHADLVFASFIMEDNYNLPSYVYFGDGKGSFPDKTEVLTHGARAISSADLDRDGHLDLIVSNYSDGQNRTVPSAIHWGDGTGQFPKQTLLSTLSAFGHSAADLDRDGYPDIVFSHYSDGDRPAENSSLYWGDAAHEFRESQSLETYGALGNAIADLNHDGFPDIIFTSHNVNGSAQPSYIYWGSGSRRFETRTEIATRSPYAVAAADLNHDGFDDLVFTEFSAQPSVIYWGSADSSYSPKTELATQFATGVAIADLNGDRHPEIVISCHKDAAGSFDTDSKIFWGARKNPYQKQTGLATRGAHGIAIADLNGDGFPELVFSNLHAAASYIYWGNRKGHYEIRTEVKTLGANGVSAGEGFAYGQDFLKQ